MSAHRSPADRSGTPLQPPDGDPGRRQASGRRNGRPPAAALAALAFLCASVHAQSVPSRFGGNLALGSQLVDRGLAITAATPVLQGAVSWASPSGWSLGAAAGGELRSPGPIAEALAQASRSWSLPGEGQLQASLLYYHYPSRAGAPSYRRAEADLSWIYRDVLALTVSAARPLGTDGARLLGGADANLHWPLARGLALVAGLGVAQFRPASYGYDYGYGRLGHYSYGQAGLAWTAGRWRVELDRIATDGAPRPRQGTGGPSPWLGSVVWSF